MNAAPDPIPDDAATPCRSEDSDLWFSDSPRDLERARSFCGGCPLRRDCLAGALARQEPWGVWGGEIFERGAVRRELPLIEPNRISTTVTYVRTPAESGPTPSSSALSLAELFARVLPPSSRQRYVEEYRAEIWDLFEAGRGRWRQLGHVLRLGMRTAELYAVLLRRRRVRS